jgi:hypothetical protein
MPSPLLLPQPDGASARTIKRSRVVSYVLAAIGVVALSFAPSVLGDPQQQPLHTLLHVVRPVFAIALLVAALAVQVVVGVRWRAGVRAANDADGTPPSQEPHE